MSITTSASYVIKVYTTKANAQSDTSPLSITSYGVGQVSGHEDDQYFVGFRKYYYRVEFNEPVAGFYIDWDDGEDNSQEKSNSQVVYLDKPQHYGVVDHIYTKSGKFFPLVRVISTDGYWSKYYTTGNANNTFGELDDRTVANIGTGSQDTSLLHLDTQTSTKIPFFYPTTLPPVAVLKVDRKTVYSGIYNTNIEGNLARRGLPSMVYAWFSGESTVPDVHKNVPVEVTYETVGGEIKTVTLNTKYDAIAAATPVAIYDVWKILEAKLKYCTEAASAGLAGSNMLYPGERVYLRFCHIASIQSTAVPELQSQTQATGSLTDRVFINYASTGTAIPNASKILISGTTNFNGQFTATNQFTVSGIAQPGDGTCVVTTSANIGVPAGQVVTLADCGAFTGDQTISTINSATQFEFLTGVTGVTAGGSAKATMKNGFMIDRTTSSMPSAEADTGGWGVYDHANDPVICCLSTGWPHHVFEERGFFTTIDASESRTRASNLTIPENRANLFLDRGDFSFNRQVPNTDYATDLLTAANTRMDTYRERHAYTHDPYVDNDFVGVRGILDDRATVGDNRFLDDYRLLRLQVKDDRTETAYDKLSYSKLESVNDTVYTAATTAGKHYPSEVEESNLLLTTPDKGVTWTDAVVSNDDTANDIITLADSDVITAGAVPLNNILIAKSERKFDRLFIGLKNIDTTNLKDYTIGKCRISLQYPVKDPLTNGIKFRALPFTDFTRAPKPDEHAHALDPDFVSLAVNGPLVFEAPDDWVKCKYNTSGIVWPTNVTAASAWDFDSYCILMTIGWEQTDAGEKPHIKYIYPFDNTHSEVIKVTDSMHVSLNSLVIAQSVSWNRRGKYINITDRIGRSEIRKIGSEGGSIRFGGIAFGDYSTSTTGGMTSYNNVKKYQQEGTPVYLDVQRPDGTYVRFFGKIINLSEDVPTGRTSNKWAVELATEAVAEIANDGTWLSDGLISLGGILDERPQFI